MDNTSPEMTLLKSTRVCSVDGSVIELLPSAAYSAVSGCRKINFLR